MGELKRAEIETLYERRRRLWLAGDARAYLELWADDLVVELPGHPEPICGKAPYAKFIENAFRGMRPISWEFHRLAIDGDCVLSEWTLVGELRASGKVLTFRGMSTCRLADGLLQEWREYWDSALLRSQLG